MVGVGFDIIITSSSSSSCWLVISLGLPQASVAVGLVLSCCWTHGMHNTRHAGLHLVFSTQVFSTGAEQGIVRQWLVALQGLQAHENLQLLQLTAPIALPCWLPVRQAVGTRC